jgi:hypothetical protein
VLWWQDQEVGYFHGFLHGVDYVFVDAPCFHAAADNIYGGSRQVTPHAPGNLFTAAMWPLVSIHTRLAECTCLPAARLAPGVLRCSPWSTGHLSSCAFPAHF